LAVAAVTIAGALISRQAGTRIWIATQGAQSVGDDKLSLDSTCQAVLWGIGRVLLHEEHPGMRGGLIDLDPSAQPDTMAEILSAELGQNDGEDQTAYRANRRYRLRLRPTGLPDHLEFAVRQDSAYVITGTFA